MESQTGSDTSDNTFMGSETDFSQTQTEHASITPPDTPDFKDDVIDTKSLELLQRATYTDSPPFSPTILPGSASSDGLTERHGGPDTIPENGSDSLFVDQEDHEFSRQSDVEEPQNSDSEYEDDSDIGTDTGEVANQYQQEDQSILKEHGTDAANRTKKTTSGKGSRGPQAKTSKEYVSRQHRKAHERLKQYLRSEQGKKRRSEDRSIDIAPPKAKRRRQANTKPKMTKSTEAIDNTATMFHGFNNVVDSACSGAIPASSQKRITVDDRHKQMSATMKTHGNDNRHRSTQRSDVKEAMKIFGHGKVVPFGETSFQIKGMRAKIHDWQLTPAAWMSKRENAEMAPYGGILADVPGMGKTVVTLSCIVGNPPDEHDIRQWSGSTLVILPSLVVAEQWQEQIIEHVECIGEDDVYFFRRNRNNLSTNRIAQFKIVLTTYHELLAEFPSKETLAQLTDEYINDPRAYRDAFKMHIGELFHINWYRVVLDEVHQIKNLASRTCLAAHQLRAKHFWGLSGTPLVNRGTELFPYLKLIGVEGITTEEAFIKDFLNDAGGPARLDALVNLVSYRRTEDDDFLGRKMLDLPPFHPGDQWVNLSKEEKIIYDAVGTYYETIHPPMPTLATLRRRQIVSHPYLLEKCLRKDVEPNFIGEMASSLLELEGKMSIYHQIGTCAQRRDAPPKPAMEDESTEIMTSKKGRKKKQSRKQKQKAKTVSEPEPILPSPEDDELLDPFGKSNFGHNFSMAALLDLTANQRLVDEQKCVVCKKKSGLINPVRIRSCEHMFCAMCFMKKYLKKKNAKHVCPKCKEDMDLTGWEHVPTLSTAEAETQEDDEVAEEDYERPATGSKLSRKQKAELAQRKRKAKKAVGAKYGGDFNGILPVLDADDQAYIRIGVNNDMGVPCASSKLTATKDVIMRWKKEAPEDKIIIFVQFVKTAMVTGIMLNLEETGHVYLTGTMTPTEKRKNINDFKTNPEVKVLIASMRCGGQALNLTCANRVILIDVWWNSAAERQAFGRVFRLGQIKDSHFVRILARKTIDERIRNLQDHKSDEIAAVLQDDGHVPELLGEWEVMALTAPQAWAKLKADLLHEIEEENMRAAEALLQKQREQEKLAPEQSAEEEEQRAPEQNVPEQDASEQHEEEHAKEEDAQEVAKDCETSSTT